MAKKKAKGKAKTRARRKPTARTEGLGPFPGTELDPVTDGGIVTHRTIAIFTAKQKGMLILHAASEGKNTHTTFQPGRANLRAELNGAVIAERHDGPPENGAFDTFHLIIDQRIPIHAGTTVTFFTARSVIGAVETKWSMWLDFEPTIGG